MEAVARGWESKSVEAQQAEAAEGRSPAKPRLTAAQVAKLRNKEGLLLSRSRVLQQLQTSHSPAHREMLEKTLIDLNARIAQADK